MFRILEEKVEISGRIRELQVNNVPRGVEGPKACEAVACALRGLNNPRLCNVGHMHMVRLCVAGRAGPFAAAKRKEAAQQ